MNKPEIRQLLILSPIEHFYESILGSCHFRWEILTPFSIEWTLLGTNHEYDVNGRTDHLTIALINMIFLSKAKWNVAN